MGARRAYRHNGTRTRRTLTFAGERASEVWAVNDNDNASPCIRSGSAILPEGRRSRGRFSSWI